MSQQVYIRDAEYGLTVPVLLSDTGEVTVTGEMTVEPGTDPVVTEDFHHSELLAGRSYLGGLVDTGVAGAASVTLGMTVSGTVTSLHSFFRTVAGGDAELWLYENVTFSGGTPVTMFNRNRISTNTLGCVSVVSTPSIGVAGTVIAHSIIAGGNRGAFTTGGSVFEERGWVLKPNTQYVAKVTNLAAGAEPITLGVAIVDEI